MNACLAMVPKLEGRRIGRTHRSKSIAPCWFGRAFQDVVDHSLILFSEPSLQSCKHSSPRAETGRYVDREGGNNREEKRSYANGQQ
jgi:hypothetical protein